jgi:hypothetical protein
MRRMWGLLACVGLSGQALMAWSDALPMVSRASLMINRAPLNEPLQPAPAASSSLMVSYSPQIAQPDSEHGASSGLLARRTAIWTQPDEESRASPSLFAGRAGNSLLARPEINRQRGVPRQIGRGPIGELRALIARAEAGPDGYDAVQHGARIVPSGPPTTLTLQQIYDWIDDTPGQPHAIGRYQFIPATLRRLVRASGLGPQTRFSPRVQDQLANLLLIEAGLMDFLSGSVDRRNFMNNLAKIWAGLPNDSGKSHYEGYAGNKATMTWAYFDTQMARIFPG